jgi:hypothetical protein
MDRPGRAGRARRGPRAPVVVDSDSERTFRGERQPVRPGHAIRPNVARLEPDTTYVRSVALVLLSLWTVGVPAATADFLPSRPLTLWNDRVTVSGELTFTFGTEDDGYFNTIDYDHDAFNVLSGSLSAEVRVTDRVAVLGQLVDEVALRGRDFGPVDWHVIRPYALYVRVQPWRDRPFFVQAGQIPPVFGTFARVDYGQGNPLIGIPLAYHYPTVIRRDVVPPSVDELMANRADGWYVRYPPESDVGEQGVPLVSGRRWDTGVQVSWRPGVVEMAGAFTNGSLSKPRLDDDNEGKEFSARVAWRPSAGFTLGASIARGEFVSDVARATLPPEAAIERYDQEGFGVDLEYSGGYTLLRGEVVVDRWETPFRDGAPTRRLGSVAAWVEGKVKLSPRWYVAARGERLDFSRIGTGIARGQRGNRHGSRSNSGPGSDTGNDYWIDPPLTFDPRTSWDAPVNRVEVGAGYLIQRNVKLKTSYQYNWRDGGRVRREGCLAAQLAYWF